MDWKIGGNGTAGRWQAMEAGLAGDGARFTANVCDLQLAALRDFQIGAINSMEMNMEALKEIQRRFYTDFPPHEKEKIYKFATPSTMKPTQWSYPRGGLSQIPGECTISGDVRLTPFYSTSHVVEKLKGYVEDINERLETTLDTRGPVSKYVLPDENLRGRLEITFDEEVLDGVACNLESRGFKALCKATEEIVGHVEPYSITGSLPLIRELQDEGFDVQTAGYDEY